MLTAITLTILFGLFVLTDRLGLDWLILKLAEIDKWWSRYRMLPEGGTIKMYSKGLGTKKGDFGTLLYGHIPDWYYHAEDHRFYHKNDPLFKEKFPDGPPLFTSRLAHLGVGRVGFFRHIYRRNRSWTTWGQVGEKPTDYGLKNKKMEGEEAEIFYFSTKMAVRVESIRTKDLVLVHVNVPFNVLLLDPQKAEFLAGKPEDQAISAVRSRAAEFIRNRTYTDLQAESDTKGTNDFVDVILRANVKQQSETGSAGLIEAYGIQIIEPRFEDFELIKEEGDQDVEDALKRKQIAGHDLETADILLKKAEKDGQADAVKIAARVGAWASKPEGVRIREAEALENTKVSALSLSGQGLGLLVHTDKNPPTKEKGT